MKSGQLIEYNVRNILFCEIFKNTFSYKTPPVAASEHSWIRRVWLILIGFYLHFFLLSLLYTAHKMKFSSMDFFSKCDQICKKLHISSYLLKKSLIENFIFCAAICRLEVEIITIKITTTIEESVDSWQFFYQLVSFTVVYSCLFQFSS